MIVIRNDRTDTEHSHSHYTEQKANGQYSPVDNFKKIKNQKLKIKNLKSAFGKPLFISNKITEKANSL